MTQDRKLPQSAAASIDRGQLEAARHSIRLRPSFVRLQRMSGGVASERRPYPSLSSPSRPTTG